MDYALEMKRFIVKSKQEHTYELLSVMESESEFVLTCLEAMSIVDGLEVVTEAKKGPGIWEKLKEFFKNLFSVFSSKASRFTGRDNKWLNDNVTSLRNIDVKGISIEMVPYWKVTTQNVKTVTQNMINKLFSDVKNVRKQLAINVADANVVTRKTMGKKVEFDALKKYDGIPGFKNYLRTGSSKNSEPVTLSDMELKRLLPSFIEYCLNYERDIVPFIKSQMNYIDKEVKSIESHIKSVKENTLFIEECSLLESELRYCQGFDIIKEAEEEKAKSATDITVNKAEDKEESKDITVKKSGTEESKDKYYSNKTTAELKYLNEGLSNIKLVLTTAMTVLEEKYITYMKLLRSIKSNGTEGEGENMVKKAKK